MALTTNEAKKPVRRAPAISRRRARFPIGWLVPALLIGGWFWVANYHLVPPQILPSPSDIWLRGLEMFDSGELGKHALASLRRLVAGLTIGGVLGTTIGVLTGTSVFLDRLFAPTLRFLTPVPVFAWMPILVLLLGIGEVPKVALMAIGVFFVLFTSAYAATRSLSAAYLDVARMFGKKRSTILYKVIIPGSLPSILEGIRAGLALSWVVLVAAEMIVSTDGLGWLLWDARTFGRTTDAYVATISVGLLGLGGDFLIQLIRAQVVDWKNEFRGL